MKGDYCVSDGPGKGPDSEAGMIMRGCIGVNLNMETHHDQCPSKIIETKLREVTESTLDLWSYQSFLSNKIMGPEQCSKISLRFTGTEQRCE